LFPVVKIQNGGCVQDGVKSFFIFHPITQPNTIFSFEKNHRFLHNFGALSPNPFLDFPQTRQVSEITLNESSKNTQTALIEWFRNETTRYFTKTKVYVVYLGWSLVIKTIFGKLFSTSGLSEICEIRNVGEIPSPFSMITLI
jgi:hypothetical protein